MQALEHPFLKKGGKVPDAAVAALAAPAKAAGDASAAAAAPPAASAAAQQQRKEAAEMKESDRLQVDGTMVRQTLEAERWRELIQLVMSVRPLPRLMHAMQWGLCTAVTWSCGPARRCVGQQ